MRVPVPRLPNHALASAAAAAILSSCILSVAPGPSLAAELGAGAVVMDRVDRVVDGDTLVLDNLGRVRLIGMNTPETVAPAQRQGAPPQCYGPEASAATKALLPKGTSVRLETDEAPRDKYGRALAYVFREPDDTFINGRLVEQGFARVKTYKPNTRYEGLLTSLQSEAKANRRGLWRQCETPAPPSPPSRPSTPSPPPPTPQSSAAAAPRPTARATGADSGRVDATGLGNPGDSKNCKDFASYGEAKAWFDKYYPMYGDVAKLDGNGDGRPCESLLPKSGGRQ